MQTSVPRGRPLIVLLTASAIAATVLADEVGWIGDSNSCTGCGEGCEIGNGSSFCDRFNWCRIPPPQPAECCNDEEPCNWCGAEVPGSGDDAIFDGVDLSLSFGCNPSNARAIVRDAAVMLDLQGHAYDLIEGGDTGSVVVCDQPGCTASLAVRNGALCAVGDVFVGCRGSGQLDIELGGVVTSGGANLGGAGADGSVTVQGSGSTWLNLGDLFLAEEGTASLTVTGGGDVVNGELASGGSGGVATMVVSGPGSSWSNTHANIGGESCITVSDGGALSFSGSMSIGSGADPGNPIVKIVGAGSTLTTGGFCVSAGSMDVQNGGSVSSGNVELAFPFGSQATLCVDGNSSLSVTQQLTVATDGTASLTITDGGEVTSGQGVIANGSLGKGHVSVCGIDARWENTGGLDISRGGTGTLEVCEGGVVTSDEGTVGCDPGGLATVTIDGFGSRWINTDELVIGADGTGDLSISNGGRVDGPGVIGGGAGSCGSVTVDDSGSQWVTTDVLVVGDQGNGTLTISGGGRVTGEFVVIGYDLTGEGTVIVNGPASELTSTGPLEIGNLGEATLTLENGATISGSDVTVNATGELNGNGTVADRLVNSGMVSPGLSLGLISVTDDYVQNADGRLRIELIDVANDVLDVSGAVELAGTLELSLVAAPVGTMYTIIDAGSVMGTFDAIDGPAGFVTVLYESAAVKVLVIANPVLCGNGEVDEGENCSNCPEDVECPPGTECVDGKCESVCVADLDGSGAVDFGDILAILVAWGNAGGPEDLDGSGVVDFGDILVVLVEWGACP